MSTPPAKWVMRQTVRRERRIAVGLAVFILVDGLIAALVIGHRMTVAASALFLAFVFLVRGPAERYVERHIRLRGGARAEEAVGLTLNTLRAEGWTVLHDIKPADGANIDHLVSGPTGVYVIDTKARRYEETHLDRVMQQALALHDQIDCFVTPVICLKERDANPFKTKGVWVVPHAHLVGWLREQRNQTVEFERLARWADGL